MRKTVFITVFLLLSGWLWGNGLEFQTPSFKNPYYRIQFQFEVKKEKCMLQELQLNDTPFENFLVFAEGKRIDA